MDARLSPALESYRRIVGLCIGLKTTAESFRALMNNDIRVTALANFLKSLNEKQSQISGLYSIAVRDIAAAVHDLFNDPNYQLGVELVSLGALIDAVKAQIVAVIPVSSSGEAEERILTATTETPTFISSVLLTALISATDALIANIEVN